MASNNQDIALLNNDLVIVDGDLAISFSDDQHIQDTVNAFPGWWKENPADGVGLQMYLRSSGLDQQLARAIKLQLRADGYSANPKLSYDREGKLLIEPNATV